MSTNETRLLIAEIGAAHGIRGQVKLRVYCDDLNLIDGQNLFTHETGDKTLKIILDRVNDQIILARVDGAPDRTAAEKLRGTKLYINRDTLPEIEDDGVYYQTDLLDLEARDINGKPIGTILNIVNFGASDLIEIKPNIGPSFYLPFTDDHVPEIDVDGGFITVKDFEPFLPEPPKPKKEKPVKSE